MIMCVLFTLTYSLYLRERIIRLPKSLHGNKLVNALWEEGFRVSRSGVYYVLKKYRKSGKLFDYPRSGQPKILSEGVHQLIDEWLHDNNELTTNDAYLSFMMKRKSQHLDHHSI